MAASTPPNLDMAGDGTSTRSVTPVPMTPELAAARDRINQLHLKIGRAATLILEMARDAGQILLQVKEQLPHGAFLDWVHAHCQCRPREAQRYMAIARKWPLIEARMREADLQGGLTITQAAALTEAATADDLETQSTPEFRRWHGMQLQSRLLDRLDALARHQGRRPEAIAAEALESWLERQPNPQPTVVELPNETP